MAFGTDFWTIVKTVKCPKCLGPMETIIKNPSLALVYAKCLDNNCQLRPDQIVAVRTKSIEKIRGEEIE